MRLDPSRLIMDWSDVEKRIERFIKDYAEKTGAKGTVIGLSGGIDSCVTAALTSRALGGHRVEGLLLPERETFSRQDVNHAELVAKKFHLRTRLIDITPTLESFYRTLPAFKHSHLVSKGNVKARTRMIYIYYYANSHKMLVCGSSDKSETMMGYFTKWGDIAADISPIMDLYKTQIRHLARHMGLPAAIVKKPSSPALWPGQLAENELGVKYETLDLVLYGLERFMKTSDIAKQLRISTKTVNSIKRRWLSVEHKRRLLLTAKLEYRTVGTDFRLPRDSY